MKKTLAILLVLAAIGAAIWSGITRRTPPPASAATVTPEERYTFEAQGVVLRQLDAEGKLQYEIEAERIVQLADGGVEATQLSFNRTPPGATSGGLQRLTLTADKGVLPVEEGIVQLSGQVRGQGTRTGGSNPLHLAADELNYDLMQEAAFTDGEVEVKDGGDTYTGRGVRVNVAAGTVTVESVHGKILL